MMPKNVVASGAIIVALGGAGAVAGHFMGNAANAADVTTVSGSNHHSPVLASPAAAKPHHFSTNARGLTYGSIADAASPSDDPALVMVVATNGKTGYVYDSQLNPAVSSPTQAKSLTGRNKAGRVIPVYLNDGHTKIGVFKIGGAQ